MKNYNKFIILEGNNEIERLVLENCGSFLSEMKGSDDVFYRGYDKIVGDYVELVPLHE